MPSVATIGGGLYSFLARRLWLFNKLRNHKVFLCAPGKKGIIYV